MYYRTAPAETALPTKNKLRAESLKNRADDLLIAIAVLGLVATVADGEPDLRELDSFTRQFGKRFVLSKRESLRLIGLALKRIRTAGGENIVDCACDTINEHLNLSQKTGIFEALCDVLIADGRIHEGEEFFLDYIAGKLDLLKSLEKRYAGVLTLRTTAINPVQGASSGKEGETGSFLQAVKFVRG